MQNTDKPDSILRANAAALARLLDEWMQGDATEQKATFEVL